MAVDQTPDFQTNYVLLGSLVAYYLGIYRGTCEVMEKLFTLNKMSKLDRQFIEAFSKIGPDFSALCDAEKMKYSYNNSLEEWKTPNKEIMAQLLFFHDEFQQKTELYGGLYEYYNLWIVKPASNARGNGIYITDSLEDILGDEKGDTAAGKDTLVQKYLEAPLLLELDSFKYKFDIRQWVLVTSLNPLTVYIFEGFYCRMCSNPFDFAAFKDTSRHLTNYSVNKGNFLTGQGESKQSVYDDKFLKDYLKKNRNFDWESEMQPRIEQIIVEALRAGTHAMKPRKRSFEIYGFDLFITDDLDPYLLEINLSPACDEREDFLIKMLEDMTVGLFCILKEKETAELEAIKNAGDNNIRNPSPNHQAITKSTGKTAVTKGAKIKPDSKTIPIKAAASTPIMSRLEIPIGSQPKYGWKQIYKEDLELEGLVIHRPGSEAFLTVAGTALNIKSEMALDHKIRQS